MSYLMALGATDTCGKFQLEAVAGPLPQPYPWNYAMMNGTRKGTTMNVEIAQRLAARRKQAGLSQEALAEQLGVSRQAVSKWERSESSPDTDNLIALARLYGVSLDDLLYVDDELQDDVEFEAADRASERATGAGAARGAGIPSADEDVASATAAEADAKGTDDPTAGTEGAQSVSGKKAPNVRIGPGGVHVLDGDDYVHVSWRDGVHVKDGKKGEEVHVGWGGIHVKERGSGACGPGDCADRGSRPADEGERDGNPGDCFGSRDGEGNEFVVDGEGVVVNGERYDSWRDAHERYGYGHLHDERWNDPCGYTVNGERFDTLEEARAKYGPGVGTSIPVRKHYLREFEKSWCKFLYPLVVIVAYLLLGILNGAWGMGLFLFFTVPLYYMVGHAIGRRRIAPLVSGAYPICVTAWFCYMAFVLNAPHPAWVAFLTVPVVEWLVHSLKHWWRHRKRAKAEAKDAPIDVDAE